jgi:hypothetical protein
MFYFFLILFICFNSPFYFCSIVLDYNGHTVSYEKFYESLKPRGEISTEVMAAFVKHFNGRIDGNKEDKKSIMKISFNPFFVVAFLSNLFLINSI